MSEFKNFQTGAEFLASADELSAYTVATGRALVASAVKGKLVDAAIKVIQESDSKVLIEDVSWAHMTPRVLLGQSIQNILSNQRAPTNIEEAYMALLDNLMLVAALEVAFPKSATDASKMTAEEREVEFASWGHKMSYELGKAGEKLDEETRAKLGSLEQIMKIMKMSGQKGDGK